MACILVIFCCIFIAACGFRPLYQNGTTLTGNDTALDNIGIVAPGGSTGLMLKNALIDRFYHHGYPDHPRYILTISLQELARSLAIQKDDTTSRAQMIMRAIYSVQDKQSNQVIDHGDIRAVSSYNVLESQYTTLVTQTQARENTIRELADKLTMRMVVVLDNPSSALPVAIAPEPERIPVFATPTVP